MLLRWDPFRDSDQLREELLGRGARRIPMDAYRRGDTVWIHLDLPGVDPASIDLSIDKSTMTVSASRGWPEEENDQIFTEERPQGTYERQIVLSEGLDTEGIEAKYEHGVLTISIPVAEKPEPRRIQVTRSEGPTTLEG